MVNQYSDYFSGKHITLMGLGRLGRGVGDARFLAECGAKVLVTDLKTEEELSDSVKELQEYDNITFVLGEHRKEDFAGRAGQGKPDMVIKAAGVPLDSPYIAAAVAAGVPVTMSTSLFARLSPATTVGVTGTRGKSTVTHILASILEVDGRNVFRGGNVQGVSTLEHLPESTEDEIAVLELDSWQLQGFRENKISPHIAIFTNFMDDHLNYYEGDKAHYLDDKAQIFLHQNAGDVLVLSEQAKEVIDEAGYRVPSQGVVVNPEEVPSEWQENLPGKHNRLNIVLALEAARKLGVSDEVSERAVKRFKGVPGRLQFVKEERGVRFYNDTTATTPDATVVALRALQTNTVLIVGGADKDLDLSELVEEIPKHCKAVVLLPGTGSEKMKNEISNIKTSTQNVKSMEEAVEKAVEVAEKGDTVLLSPAFASFGLFDNEYQRGEKFMEALNKLRS